MEILLNFIVSALGAAVAAFLGVRFAMQKFRGEKSFERQLDWHERSVKVLQNYATLAAGLAWRLESFPLNKVSDPSEREITQADNDTAWEELSSADKLMATTVEEVELYGSPEACIAMREFARHLNELVDQPPLNETQDFAAKLRRIVPIASQAARILTCDARKLLGLPPAPP